jgi:cell division protein FtsB
MATVAGGNLPPVVYYQHATAPGVVDYCADFSYAHPETVLDSSLRPDFGSFGDSPIDYPNNYWYIDSTMDDQFYRKDKKPFDVKERALRLLRNKRFVVRFTLAAIVVSFVLFGNHGVVQRLRLQHQKSELADKVRDAEAETKHLQAESKALDGDAKAIEKAAREKHGMIREGETVYKVNKK